MSDNINLKKRKLEYNVSNDEPPKKPNIEELEQGFDDLNVKDDVLNVNNNSNNIDNINNTNTNTNTNSNGNINNVYNNYQNYFNPFQLFNCYPNLPFSQYAFNQSNHLNVPSWNYGLFNQFYSSFIPNYKYQITQHQNNLDIYVCCAQCVKNNRFQCDGGLTHYTWTNHFNQQSTNNNYIYKQHEL